MTMILLRILLSYLLCLNDKLEGIEEGVEHGLFLVRVGGRGKGNPVGGMKDLPRVGEFLRKV